MPGAKPCSCRTARPSGSHRKLRKKDIREAGLQEIPGIGPSRKRALLHHFGTLKEIERASIADLGKVPGVSAESARKFFKFFLAQPGKGGAACGFIYRFGPLLVHMSVACDRS